MTFPTKFPSDLQIAREARLKPLEDIADEMSIGPHLLEPYGDAVAKIKLEAIEELKDRPRAKYVLISAITPTPLGEGKTTTTTGSSVSNRTTARSSPPKRARSWRARTRLWAASRPAACRPRWNARSASVSSPLISPSRERR